jgi:hypothetical protein
MWTGVEMWERGCEDGDVRRWPPLIYLDRPHSVSVRLREISTVSFPGLIVELSTGDIYALAKSLYLPTQYLLYSFNL